MLDSAVTNSETGESASEYAALTYLMFCILSIASRVFYPIFVLVVAFGLAFPVLWSRAHRESGGNVDQQSSSMVALGWGAGLGSIYFGYMVISPGAWSNFPPPFFEMQLLIGGIVFAIVMAPFQELFFRKWLQDAFEKSIGPRTALILTSLLFMMWHWLPPFTESASIDLQMLSISASFSTFLLGLVCGFAYQKTRRLKAPWLAHLIAGMGLILLGQLVVFQYVQ